MEPRDDVREALLQIQRKLGQAAVASATSQPAPAPQPFHTLPGAEDLPTFAAFIAHRQNRTEPHKSSRLSSTRQTDPPSIQQSVLAVIYGAAVTAVPVVC